MMPDIDIVIIQPHRKTFKWLCNSLSSIVHLYESLSEQSQTQEMQFAWTRVCRFSHLSLQLCSECGSSPDLVSFIIPLFLIVFLYIGICSQRCIYSVYTMYKLRNTIVHQISYQFNQSEMDLFDFSFIFVCFVFYFYLWADKSVETRLNNKMGQFIRHLHQKLFIR